MSTTPLHRDASPMESNVDRLYWSPVAPNRMMPGLGLAAARYGWRMSQRHPALTRRSAPQPASHQTSELRPPHS